MPWHSRPAAGSSANRDVVAIAALALLLLHVLFAQLTLILAIAFAVTGQLARWRPQWLAGPAAAGLIWSLAVGPASAAAGFTAGPGQVARYLAAAVGHPAALVHLSRGFAGAPHWLPRQFPLALITAAAEAALAGAIWRLRRRRAGQPARYRTGPVVAARRRVASAALAAGSVVTADGACLGLDPATGRRVTISWAEAERGVLATGPDQADLERCGAALALAAIRRRKAVLVIDLAGGADLAAALTAGCAAAGAPLHAFGPAGPGCYEPARGSRPARMAALTAAMIDWSAVSDVRRRACASYLADACAVLAAAPGDPRRPVLDELAWLLQPGALLRRAALVPGSYPGAGALADRAGAAERLLSADPAAVSAGADQLTRLRGAALGRWLRPGEPAISVGGAMRDRAVVTFALDRSAHGRSAAMIAALAAADLLDVLTELQAMAVRTDCLAWIHGCEALPARRLADLIRMGAKTGAGVLLTTTSGAAAAALAGAAGVIVARGTPDPAVTAALRAGPGGDDSVGKGSFGAPDGQLPDLGAAALTLLVRGPGARYLPGCEAARAPLTRVGTR